MVTQESAARQHLVDQQLHYGQLAIAVVLYGVREVLLQDPACFSALYSPFPKAPPAAEVDRGGEARVLLSERV
jgi:hypothetical protein